MLIFTLTPLTLLHRFEIIPIPLLYAGAGMIVVVSGPRYNYRMYDALNWPMVALLFFRVAPRFVRRWAVSTPSPAEK